MGKSPTQTFDAFEYTGPSGVSSFYSSSETTTGYQKTNFQISTSESTVSSSVQRTDERGVALPEFIGTLGGDASAALTSKVEVAGMKTSWKDTTWSESEIMESQKPKFTNQTHSDIHVLDSKTIGPSSTHDKTREDPQFLHFGGSFQEHGSHDLSLQVKQDQSWEPLTASSSTEQYSKSGGKKHQKKGKLEKEYSVASDNDDTVEDKKSSIRELKEYSVVSESEDKDGKEWTKRITGSSTVVVSLEKNEEVSAAPPAEKKKNEEKQETTKSEVSKPCQSEEPAEEPKTYTRKKKKGKKDYEDKEKDVDTSLETTVVGTSADLQMKGAAPEEAQNQDEKGAKKKKKKKKPPGMDASSDSSPTLAK